MPPTEHRACSRLYSPSLGNPTFRRSLIPEAWLYFLHLLLLLFLSLHISVWTAVFCYWLLCSFGSLTASAVRLVVIERHLKETRATSPTGLQHAQISKDWKFSFNIYFSAFAKRKCIILSFGIYQKISFLPSFSTQKCRQDSSECWIFSSPFGVENLRLINELYYTILQYLHTLHPLYMAHQGQTNECWNTHIQPIYTLLFSV